MNNTILLRLLFLYNTILLCLLFLAIWLLSSLLASILVHKGNNSECFDPGNPGNLGYVETFTASCGDATRPE